MRLRARPFPVETDTDFILGKNAQGPRKHFPPPKLPSDYVPQHRPLVTPVKQMPANIRKIGERLTPVERARLLGEGDVSVMSLLRDEDRRRLERTKSRWEPPDESPRSSGRAESDRKQDQQQPLPFADNPTKQARYKEYINYLKRGRLNDIIVFMLTINTVHIARHLYAAIFENIYIYMYSILQNYLLF